MNLTTFVPNNHSKWQINFKPINTDEVSLLTSLLEENFRSLLDCVTRIEQVDEAEVNSNNFKIVGEKNGKSVQFLLRRYPGKRNKAAIEEVHRAILFLWHEGCRVPEIFSADFGQDIVEYRANYYSLFRFFSGDHYRGTPEELQDAATQFAILDAKLKVLPNAETLRALYPFSPETLQLREYSTSVYEDLFSRASAHLFANPDDEFDKRFLSLKDFLFAMIRQTPFGEYTKVPKQIIHFDLHPHNLLADGAHITSVLDFDSLQYLERIRGVAFALHRMVRQHIIFTHPLDIPRAVTHASSSFLDQYQTNNSLIVEELEAIPYFIRQEALARLSYAMKDFYINNNSAWKQDLEKQVMALAEAELFNKESFLL